MAYPDSIQIPSQGGGGSGAGRATSADTGDNSDHLRAAIDSIARYLQGETDDEDLAEGSKLLAAAQGLLAKQQQLVDKATGAGPGARLVRKATAQQSQGY